MSSESELVNGPYRVDALGTVTLISRGSGMYLRASGEDSNLAVEATKSADLSCKPAQITLTSESEQKGQVLIFGGPMGKIIEMVGAPMVGAQIKLEPTAITLSVGPPGVGASISLSPEAITLKVAAVSYKLSVTGIEETVAVVSRKADFVGHTLTAAESTLKVDVTGVSSSGPLVKSNADVASKTDATLMQTSVSGMDKTQASILMLG